MARQSGGQVVFARKSIRTVWLGHRGNVSVEISCLATAKPTQITSITFAHDRFF